MSGSKIQKYGITLPVDVVARFNLGTYFTVQISGTAIILCSGGNLIPTKEEVDNFDLESLRVTSI